MTARAWRSLGGHRLQRRQRHGGAGHAGLQLDRGVEDGRCIEAAVRQLDRIEAGATGRPGMEELGEVPAAEEGVEEPATPGCSWTEAVGGRTSQCEGGQVPALDDGAAATIDLSEWAWTRGRVGRT
jgi:hypothetical protein